MDEYNNYWRTSHVPPFGSWEFCQNDAVDDLPFTQCFETARHPPGISFPIYTTTRSKDRDLYSADDAVIVVPRHSQGKGRNGYQKKEKEQKRKETRWVECDAVKVAPPTPVIPKKIPKAVDEDLYKISPELLYAKPKKKRMGVLSRCLFPNCASS
ncbi:uncharacterized protein LOC124926795 [Impatiens glandulifera]|uniref:uncharacterized protein LOC124926795 n=1 Tax=Impatiens glandulifera TaxID=253017 RepID=UPI001FB13DB4|nr:uncharacterized protein LOC124926795 [Impatiens glandulifera]